MAGRSSGTDEALRALGKRLRALRAERDWTQEFTASAAGITLRMLQRLEGGETNPTLDTLVKVSSAYGLPVKELLS